MKRRNKKYILNFIYKSDDDKSAKNLDEMLERLFKKFLIEYNNYIGWCIMSLSICYIFMACFLWREKWKDAMMILKMLCLTEDCL